MVLKKKTDTIRVILCVLLWGGNDTNQMGRWARDHFPPFHICTFTHSLMIGWEPSATFEVAYQGAIASSLGSKPTI